MAVLVFLAGTARARIIASHLLLDMNRGVGLLFTVRHEIVATGLHLAHVRPAPGRLGRTRLILISQVDPSARRRRSVRLYEDRPSHGDAASNAHRSDKG